MPTKLFTSKATYPNNIVIPPVALRHPAYYNNIDKKGARIVCPVGEEVVVPISIKEMYIGVLESRLSLTIIKCISIDRRVIPLVVIIPSVLIIVRWFHENITSLKVITVSLTGYTNKGIYILLINSAICYNAPDFILKAKINRI